jgi:hypothetical protein
VLNGGRYPVPVTTQRVLPASAADLSNLPVVADPLSVLTPGVLVRTGGTVYAVDTTGQLRSVSPYSLISYGWTKADAVDLPTDVELPEVGDPLGLRDGTAVNVPGIGAGVVSTGVFHRLWNLQEIGLYGYSGAPRMGVPRSEVAGLPTAEIAGRAVQEYRHH